MRGWTWRTEPSGRPGSARAAARPSPQLPAPPREPSRGWLALAGAIAGAAGLALSQGVSEAFGADDSPLSAVAAAVRDLTPGHLAIHLVELVRHFDKPLLVGGTAVAFLAICAYAGSWARRSPNVPDITFLVLAALGRGRGAPPARAAPGAPSSRSSSGW